MSNFRTAESVSPKHPDKICDQISDAILDAYLEQDPDARVAVDVAGGHGQVFVTGEVTSVARGIDTTGIVRRLAGDDIKVIENISQQSSEISRGVDVGGAGDQGIMVGYATAETPELLPLEVVLARQLNQFIYKTHPYDGKTQVTLKDDRVSKIVASFQNTTRANLLTEIDNWLKASKVQVDSAAEIHANPAGDWSLGGFDADAGLTGRKLVIDNYGPRIPIGGGAFSGKDPSKVDRSAAYMARRIAVDYLARRGAKEVFVRLAYAIGHPEALEATVIIDGSEELVEGYDLSPGGIIQFLDLKKPIYESTARYGHFGHSGFGWEG